MSESTSSSSITRFLKAMAKLPFPVVRYLGRIFGLCFLRFDRRTRRAIDRNLELCLPDLDREQRARLRNGRLSHIGQTFMEMSHVWTKDVATILGKCEDGDGADRFKEAVAGDGGVIVLAPHIGNWEILNVYISVIRPLTVMYRPNKDPSLDAFILAARKRSGADLAPTNRRGVLQVMKALNASGVVGILPDQVPQKGSGDYAPLFGHSAYTMTLAGQLAHKTGAKAFVVGCLQTSKGFKIVAHEVDERFYSEDTQTSLTGLNASVECMVKVCPEQYQWEYKRFKGQPDGALNPYREYT